MVPLPLWLQSASPTGAKEAEEHEQKWRVTQGDAPPAASLALGWTVSRFQRFCRFAAGTWTREGTGRERQRGAVRVSCEKLTSRDGAGETPAPRLGDGRATGRLLLYRACPGLDCFALSALLPHHGRNMDAGRDRSETSAWGCSGVVRGANLS